MHILMKSGMSSDDFRRSTTGVERKCEKWVTPMLEELYEIVGKLERRERGEIGSYITSPITYYL